MLLNRQASFARIVLTHGQSHYPMDRVTIPFRLSVSAFQVRCGLLKTTGEGLVATESSVPGPSEPAASGCCSCSGRCGCIRRPRAKTRASLACGALASPGAPTPGPAGKPTKSSVPLGPGTRRQWQPDPKASGLGSATSGPGSSASRNRTHRRRIQVTGEPGVKMKKVT